MPDQRRFRFGVHQYQASSGVEWQEKAKRAESLGYDILVIPDHIAERNLLAYAPALMAAADATTTLRIGSYVLMNDVRHPAVVASETATLDLLSGGRYELGIGAGHLREDYDATGIPFGPPGVRASRLEESVQIIKSLMNGEPTTFSGQHYAITDHKGYLKPAQQPPPPILIGGGGQRMLAFAAREADIVGIMVPALRAGGLDSAFTARERVEQQIEHIRAAAGERFDQLELNILNQRLIVTDDRQSAAEDLAQEWGSPPDALLDSPYVLIGAIDEIADILRARREQFGISYIVVFERYMEAFAPVVARLAGM